MELKIICRDEADLWFWLQNSVLPLLKQRNKHLLYAEKPLISVIIKDERDV